MATKPSLVLKRRIKAAPEKVYEAWTKPEQMTHWWGVTTNPSLLAKEKGDWKKTIRQICK